MLLLGQKLAHACQAAAAIKCIIYLQGELGAGKTTLARGFLHGAGYTQSVKSPTYTIVEPYLIGNKTIYHFDLYRLTDAAELNYIGALDYFNENATSLIEWSERGTGFIPPADVICFLAPEVANVNHRIVTLDGIGVIGEAIVKSLA